MTRSRLLGAAAGVWLLAVLVQQPAAARQAPADAHRGVSFETSESCMACHNGLATPGGEDVSIGVSWRASMMAQSARDPYWQAAVRRETLDHPEHASAIENECAVCHMPLAHRMAQGSGQPGRVFALLPAAGGDSPAHRLAADGVSCALCHQIAPQGLGTAETFVGRFVLGTPDGAARMFGPYEVAAGHASVMRSATGATPAQAEHLRQSELCASCHTLITTALDAAGRPVGALPEQVPYLEWRHSEFAGERSCQSCHMPPAADTPIASVLGEAREALGRHTFLGGNFFVLRMLNRFRGELGVATPAPELETAAQATLRQLAADTATLAVDPGTIAAGRLEFDVVVRNLTGHKLPTGYPSRRVWIDLTVRDADGAAVFVSGAVDPSGRVVGNDNDEDAARYEPHHRLIERADQVQIYESVMADAAGAVTTGLLRGASYVKDNRLLPRGFEKIGAEQAIAVHGDAASDPDFTGAGDRVRYRVALGPARPPFTVEAVLRYQPIGFRWMDNLRGYDAAEPRRFVGYYEAMASGSSAVLARATATVPAP